MNDNNYSDFENDPWQEHESDEYDDDYLLEDDPEIEDGPGVLFEAKGMLVERFVNIDYALARIHEYGRMNETAPGKPQIYLDGYATPIHYIEFSKDYARRVPQRVMQDWDFAVRMPNLELNKFVVVDMDYDKENHSYQFILRIDDNAVLTLWKHLGYPATWYSFLAMPRALNRYANLPDRMNRR